MAYYPGSTYDRQSRRAISAGLSDNQADQPLPILLSQDAKNPGRPFTDLTLRAALGRPRLRDYSYWGFVPGPVIYRTGEVAPMGEQLTPENPRLPLRSRDYTYTDPLEFWLIGQDAMVVGEQLTVAAAPAKPRSDWFDPLTNFTLPLATATPAENPPDGKSSTDLPPRATARLRDYTYTDPTEIWLIGQDAMTAGVQVASALPPKGYARLPEYTFVHETDINLIGQDAMVPGQQAIGTGRATPRCADFSTPFNFTLNLDFYAQATIGPGKSTDATALPPRAAARSRDYTFLHAADVQLFGSDAMVAGTESLVLPTPARARCASFDPGTNYTLALDAAQQATVYPAGAQTTSLPPARAPRLDDYTYTNRLPNLIGQDAMTAGKSTDATSLPPKGPARARDYTWLQTYPLHVFESLPTGDSTALTELPPRAYQRMRDYTFSHDVDRQLIGQDAMVTGQQWLDTDNLPPRAYPRSRDYTFFDRIDLGILAETTHAGRHTMTITERHIHTLSTNELFVHTVDVV